METGSETLLITLQQEHMQKGEQKSLASLDGCDISFVMDTVACCCLPANAKTSLQGMKLSIRIKRPKNRLVYLT